MEIDAPVIVPYDSRWPDLFAQEREALLRLFTGKTVEIEHIGSTAVPNLGGEPVIDILLGVLELTQVQKRVLALEEMGYRSMPDLESQNPECRIFAKEAAGQHTHHLHVVEMRSEFWRHYLLFRDYLKAHETMIQQYYELKVQLARRFKDDRNAYTEAKSAFIKRMVSEAEQGLCPFC
ncbi:MAG TPA: GrpB family protein [Nitrospiria bacterium]|nr:GrpB family protein [Nitrospiria bacterium]